MNKPRRPEYAEKVLLEEICDLSLDGQESLEKLTVYAGELEDFVETLEEKIVDLQEEIQDMATDALTDDSEWVEREYADTLEGTIEQLQHELTHAVPYAEYQRVCAMNEVAQSKLNAITLINRP